MTSGETKPASAVTRPSTRRVIGILRLRARIHRNAQHERADQRRRHRRRLLHYVHLQKRGDILLKGRCTMSRSASRFTRPATIFATVAAVLVMTAPAALASTKTQSGCAIHALVGGLNGIYRQCTTVIGTGSHITSLSGYAVNGSEPTSLPPVHIELYGPNGLIKNCAQVTLGAGGRTPTCSWTAPTGPIAVGEYCSEMWIYNYPGNYTDAGNNCYKDLRRSQ